MRIDGKRIVITGASAGIGRALAVALADRGARLVLAARRLDRLEALAAQLAAAHPSRPRALAVLCDVTDRENVRTLIATATRALGGVDVLINNAGTSVYGAASRTGLEEVEALLRVNFLGALYGTLEVLPQMERRGQGVVVNLCSAAALHGVPYLAAYGASKAALAAFGQSVRAELRDTGVEIVNVYPGYVETEIFDQEKLVGGARRPPRPYAPAATVARAVVRALETGKREVVVRPEARLLALLKRLAPPATDLVMGWLALRLRDHAQVSHA